MPFNFSILRNLLNKLDQNHAKNSLKMPNTLSSRTKIVVSWFNKHNQIILQEGLRAVAFLLYLFLECRVDRVFNL